MGTTANGTPYPEPSEPVSAGAAAMKAIVDALDPPWLALTAWGAGWTALSAYPARYRIVAKVLQLSGTAYYGGGVPALSTIATLPGSSTADDVSPFAAGVMAPVTNRAGTWEAANAYLDLRASGALVCHVVTVGAARDALHLDGLSFRLR